MQKWRITQKKLIEEIAYVEADTRKAALEEYWAAESVQEALRVYKPKAIKVERGNA